MYRDDLVERFESLFDVVVCVIAVFGVAVGIAQSDWASVVIFVVVAFATLVGARRLVVRPHLVVGTDVLILVGAMRTRRLSMREVRRAVAEHGSLRLVLVDYTEVYVPGHFGRHALGKEYQHLAATINNAVARAS